MTPEIKAAAKALKRAEKAKERANAKVVEARSNLLLICDHSELEEIADHNSGSYFDRASTSKWNKCKTCGKTGPISTVQHSWYG